MSRVINATDVVRTAKALARAGKTESALHLLKYHAPVASKPDALRHRKVTTKTVDEELITDPHDDEDDDDDDDDGEPSAAQLGPTIGEFTRMQKHAARGQSPRVRAQVRQLEDIVHDPIANRRAKKAADLAMRHLGVSRPTIEVVTETHDVTSWQFDGNGRRVAYRGGR